MTDMQLPEHHLCWHVLERLYVSCRSTHLPYWAGLPSCKPKQQHTDAEDDGTLIGGLQAFDSWQEDLNYPSGWRLGLLNAVGYIAGFVVGPVIVYIDDNWGRRWGIRCELKLPTGTQQYVQCIKADEEVYGVMILIGTVIGAIAGIPQVDGYTGELPSIPHPVHTQGPMEIKLT